MSQSVSLKRKHGEEEENEGCKRRKHESEDEKEVILSSGEEDDEELYCRNQIFPEEEKDAHLSEEEVLLQDMRTAIDNGNLADIKALFAAANSIFSGHHSCRLLYGMTLVQAATRALLKDRSNQVRLDILKYFIFEQKCDADAYGGNFPSSLGMVCKANDVELVRLICSRVKFLEYATRDPPEDMEETDAKEITDYIYPIECAIQHGHVEAIKVLVDEFGYQYKHKQKFKYPLHFVVDSCGRRAAKMIPFLVKSDPGLLEGYNKKGHTALTHALLTGKKEAAVALHGCGANPQRLEQVIKTNALVCFHDIRSKLSPEMLSLYESFVANGLN